jgi:hypothetical protein
MSKMVEIQAKLKAPKSQFNSFGKYHYRSCEDIVEAVKPVLKEHGYHLILTDDVIGVLDRVYVKATAFVMDGDAIIATASAFAREPEDKKGADASQITGTASSYARKYALNGLFAIDDTKDADTDEHHAKQTNAPQQQQKPAGDDKPWYNSFDADKARMVAAIESGERTVGDILKNLRKTFKVSKETEAKIMAL